MINVTFQFQIQTMVYELILQLNLNSKLFFFRFFTIHISIKKINNKSLLAARSNK